MSDIFQHIKPGVALPVCGVLAVGSIIAGTLTVRASMGVRASAQRSIIGNAVPGTASVAAELAVPADVAESDWSVIQNVGPGLSALQLQLSKRFRLSGTYFKYTPRGSYARKAVLHDNVAQRERIVDEGAMIDDIKVARILRDRVILRDPSGLEVEIWQDVHGSRDSANAAGQSRQNVSGFEVRALERFGGKMTGDGQYVFDRDVLTAYYQELYDNPDRLVLVFDSMKPVYGSDRLITGYQLKTEGEYEFFAATGLRENDIVRTVNEVGMTNRRRAEFFIKQFALGRSSAFILNVERDGEPVKLVYQVK